MKKHRNFLIFYILWLAAIMVLLVAFDEDDSEQRLKADAEVCKVEDDYSVQWKTKVHGKKSCQIKEL